MKVWEIKEKLEKNGVKVPTQIRTIDGLWEYLKTRKSMYLIRRLKLRAELEEVENKINAIDEVHELIAVGGVEE